MVGSRREVPDAPGHVERDAMWRMRGAHGRAVALLGEQDAESASRASARPRWLTDEVYEQMRASLRDSISQNLWSGV